MIFRLNITYFVNLSKSDRADYTETTKSLIKFHPEWLQSSQRCQNVHINESHHIITIIIHFLLFDVVMNATRKESLKPALKEMSYMPSNIQVLCYGLFCSFRAQITFVIFIF